MKILFLISCLLLFCLPNPSQSPAVQQVGKCSLRTEQSPEVRGLKLGQSPNLLGGIFPDQYHGGLIEFRDAVKPDNLGLYKKIIVNRYSGSEGNLKGVDFIRLSYLDSALASIEITYSPSVQWESAAHFAAALAQQLKLPTTGWVDRIGNIRLDCQGFFVETRNSRGGRLLIEKDNLQTEIASRKAASERKKRVEFKP